MIIMMVGISFKLIEMDVLIDWNMRILFCIKIAQNKMMPY